jgi:hypothetical protein
VYAVRLQESLRAGANLEGILTVIFIAPDRAIRGQNFFRGFMRKLFCPRFVVFKESAWSKRIFGNGRLAVSRKSRRPAEPVVR